MEEVKTAVDRLSYQKASSTDEMPDRIFHQLMAEDDDNNSNLKWLSSRMEALVNSDYWP